MKDRAGKITAWNPSGMMIILRSASRMEFTFAKAVKIYAGQSWIDGSVENDLPMARISELFGVNHFIVSQGNVDLIGMRKEV